MMLFKFHVKEHNNNNHVDLPFFMPLERLSDVLCLEKFFYKMRLVKKDWF